MRTVEGFQRSHHKLPKTLDESTFRGLMGGKFKW